MKLKLNYFIDITMILVFLVCGITGILKFPELNVPMNDGMYIAFSFLHDWSGILGIALLIIHTALHATWLKTMTGKIIKADFGKKALALVLVLLCAQIPSELWAGGRGMSNPTIPQGITYPEGTLKDGTYTGSATGYMPSLNVEVVIKGGKISAVNIVSSNETPRWFNRVINVIPAKIVTAQSTDINAVSGATCSSYGIMSAVEEALKKAVK
jgi:uncharacterized protein with FMN-binding domain